LRHINRNQNIYFILKEYGELLSQIDLWFRSVQKKHPKDVVCGKGCYDCCLGLFDISLLDAYYLLQGFTQLPKSVKQQVTRRAKKIVTQLKKLQPNLNPPYYLTELSDEDIDALCDKFAELRCPLLNEKNQCLVYQYRPMTCRLHGLPMIDIKEGEYYNSPDKSSYNIVGWCERNFKRKDISDLTDLAYPFTELNKKELELFVQFTKTIFAKPVYEIYLFIPAALILKPRKTIKNKLRFD
jgi:Fe-S-cluster containining protein